MSALHCWYPHRVQLIENTLFNNWIYFDNTPFSHPFFEESILKAKSNAVNSKRYRALSQLDLLIDWSLTLDSVAPTVFIFHVSRCGSTLLSQLLSMDEKTIALAEVPFFDDVLRSSYKVPLLREDQTAELLKASIMVYGQRRNKTEKNLVIKTDSWHIFFHKMLRSLYPTVPFILLYRRPDEVIKSHQKQRGMQAVPGLIEPEVFGLSKARIENLSLDEYTALVLEKYYEAFLAVAKSDKRTLLINYSEGAATLLDKTLAFGEITTRPDLKAEMIERSKFHSKHPQKVFNEKAAETAIPDYLKRAFDAYHKIEELRQKQADPS